MIVIIILLYLALTFAGFACLHFKHKYNMAKINLDYWKDVSALMEKNRDDYKKYYFEAMELVKESLSSLYPSIDTEAKEESKVRSE